MRIQKDRQKCQKVGNGTYKQTKVEDVNVLTHDWFVLQALQQKVIAWCYIYLRHTGETRMEATLRKSFYWPSFK